MINIQYLGQLQQHHHELLHLLTLIYLYPWIIIGSLLLIHRLMDRRLRDVRGLGAYWHIYLFLYELFCSYSPNDIWHLQKINYQCQIVLIFILFPKIIWRFVGLVFQIHNGVSLICLYEPYPWWYASSQIMKLLRPIFLKLR